MADNKLDEKNNKDAESGQPVQLDKDQQTGGGQHSPRPQDQPGQQQGGQQRPQQHDSQHEGGQKR